MVITIIFLLEKKGNGNMLSQILRNYNMAWMSFTLYLILIKSWLFFTSKANISANININKFF